MQWWKKQESPCFSCGECQILTDDQAPVELLGMQVIDELIKDEVQYYKDIYKERGIKGLMESL